MKAVRPIAEDSSNLNFSYDAVPRAMMRSEDTNYTLKLDDKFINRHVIQICSFAEDVIEACHTQR